MPLGDEVVVEPSPNVAATALVTRIPPAAASWLIEMSQVVVALGIVVNQGSL